MPSQRPTCTSKRSHRGAEDCDTGRGSLQNMTWGRLQDSYFIFPSHRWYIHPQCAEFWCCSHLRETEIVLNLMLQTNVLKNYISESVTFMCSDQCIYPNTLIQHASASVCAIQEKKKSPNIQSWKGSMKISKPSS